MTRLQLDLEDELVALLGQSNRSAPQEAKELIVLELYRRGAISSGKAAELLGMPRQAFIHHASRVGIPYLDMTPEEWDDERSRSDAI